MSETQSPEVVLPQNVLEHYSFQGNDNYKNPRLDYVKKVFGMTREELLKETEQKIWLSAYANNNPRSDYHWHVDACYDACKKFSNDPDQNPLYSEAYEQARASVG